MVDHPRVGVWGGVLALGVIIGACTLAISAPALRSAQERPAVTYQNERAGHGLCCDSRRAISDGLLRRYKARTNAARMKGRGTPSKSPSPSRSGRRK